MLSSGTSGLLKKKTTRRTRKRKERVGKRILMIVIAMMTMALYAGNPISIPVSFVEIASSLSNTLTMIPTSPQKSSSLSESGAAGVKRIIRALLEGCFTRNYLQTSPKEWSTCEQLNLQNSILSFLNWRITAKRSTQKLNGILTASSPVILMLGFLAKLKTEH